MSAQRQFQRVRHKITATVHFVHGAGQWMKFPAQVVDMSVGGLCVILPNSSMGPLGPGAKAKMTFERPGGRNLESNGSVVRSIVGPDDTQQIAIRFDRVRYDIMAAMSHQQKILIELNPYGWAANSRTLVRSEA